MAARVTKLFLQNCLEARASSASASKKSTPVTGGKKAVAATTVKKHSTNNRRRKAKQNAKSGVRFLEAAQHEQKQADKTKENLRKLKTRANDKSKRLMAKALEKRLAVRL